LHERNAVHVISRCFSQCVIFSAYAKISTDIWQSRILQCSTSSNLHLALPSSTQHYKVQMENVITFACDTGGCRALHC